MGYLLGCLKKEKERTAAFQALGLLVVAVRAEIQPYLSKVLEIIKAALPPKDFAHKSVILNSLSSKSFKTVEGRYIFTDRDLYALFKVMFCAAQKC